MCAPMRAHWRHLANTIELPICRSDMALCQITLTTCYYFVNIVYFLDHAQHLSYIMYYS